MVRVITAGLIASILIVVSSVRLTAQPVSFKSRQALIDYALTHNPHLQAMKKAALASRQLPSKMGSLNDFRVGIRTNGTPSKFAGETFDQERYFVSQTWPFLGVLNRKSDLGKTIASIDELKVIQVQNQLKEQISHKSYELKRLHDTELLLIQNLNLIAELIAVSQARYEAGKSSLAPILKAKIFKGKIEESLIKLKAQKHRQTIELISVLGLPQETVLNFTPTLDQTIRALAVSSSQIDSWKSALIDYRMAELNTQVQAKGLRVSKDKFLPNISTQLEFWDNGPLKNQWSGQVALNIPWVNPGNYAAAKESQLKVQASEYAQTNVQNQLSKRIQDLVATLNQLDETIRLYDTSLLTNAKLAMENYKSLFEVGKASFLNWFEAEQRYIELELAHIKNKTNYHAHWATLENLFIEGRIPTDGK